MPHTGECLLQPRLRVRCTTIPDAEPLGNWDAHVVADELVLREHVARFVSDANQYGNADWFTVGNASQHGNTVSHGNHVSNRLANG